MRPITVTVGPLASASANNIALSQTPAAGSFILNGAKAATTFQGTGSLAGNLLTVSALTSGFIGVGTLITGAGIKPTTVKRISGGSGDGITGVGGLGTYIVDVAQTVASTTIYGGATATLDLPRRVLFTLSGNETGNTFTVTGIGDNGVPNVETVNGTTAGTVSTNTNFLSVSSVAISAGAAGAITVGTSAVASSAPVRLDEWSIPYVTIQADVSGTVNYTIQTSTDDPNSPTNVVTAPAMTWLSSPDPNVVGATAAQASYFNNAPLYARVLLNSGSGSVTATFAQSGVVTR